jgi:hypothetical protein
MTVTFEIHGQEFIALNGGPQYKFTEAISLLVTCESQAEVDRLWGALTEGGEESRAAGSRIGTASPGRSSLPPSARCSATRTRPKRNGP